MPALFLAAIHNGELADSPAAEVIDQIETLFAGLRIEEVSQQEEFRAVPDLERLREWSSRQWALERRWRTYLGRTSRAREVLATIGRQVWRARIAVRPEFQVRAWRIRQVEAAVSRKHQEAWAEFLESDRDLALILESDATWTQESAPRLSGITDFHLANKPFYANLAGGLSTQDLSIAHLEPESSTQAPNGFIRYRPPVTNTSCAYLINRLMAELLLEECSADQASVTLGIDWLVNAVFLRAWDSGIDIECWHAEPPVLTHGSTSGITRSWHPDR